MEITEQEYQYIATLNLAGQNDLKDKIIKNKDKNAARLWTAFGVFEKLSADLKRIPGMEEVNKYLSIPDKIVFRQSLWDKIKKFFKRK